MFLDSNRISVTVPEGFSSGTYNLFVTNPEGEQVALNSALTITMEIYLSAGLNGFGWPVKTPNGFSSYQLK